MPARGNSRDRNIVCCGESTGGKCDNGAHAMESNRLVEAEGGGRVVVYLLVPLTIASFRRLELCTFLGVESEPRT